jgi:hypothetical protein
VRSTQPLNLLVNYWWSPDGMPSGIDALQGARRAFGALPAAQRRAWQALFSEWVFGDRETGQAHIPPPHRE